MRKLIATVYNYSLDGLLADEGTDFWDFAFSLPENANPDAEGNLGFLRGADAFAFGRTSYESISAAMMASPEHPFAAILNAAPKVVFSRSLQTAVWPNTSIASGEAAAEVEKLRQGGDGYVIVMGGVGLWRSLIELDLLDEIHINMYPYIAGEGTRLFDGLPKSYALELISSTQSANGIVDLRYARRR